MRITGINAPDGFAGKGLKRIRMADLGALVVLVGPNGAGKSRFLDLVRIAAGAHLPADQLTAVETNLTNHRNAVAQKNQPQAHIDQWTAVVKQLEAQVEAHHAITVDQPSHKSVVTPIPFMPRPASLTRAEQVIEDQRNAAGPNLASGDIRSAATHALSYVRTVQDAYFNATHPNTSLGSEERARATAAHKTLSTLVEQLLRTHLDRDSQGRTLLFGFTADHQNLSDGQNVLLQLAVLLHVRGVALADAIILLDEPENHLHPKALVEIIERLLGLVTNGQIWAATHSVHLLAEAYRHPSAIWYLEDNQVSFAGSTPERVLRGLLGEGEHAERLADLLTLPAALATASFAADCLRPPGVADHKSGDKQTMQIASHLQAVGGQGSRALRIIDYGAGKGRLLAALTEQSITVDACRSGYDYRAYEPNVQLQVELRQLVSTVYGKADDRVFATRDELQRLNDNSVDVAVLTNVLHEIDPRRWLDELGPTSVLSKKVSTNGYVMIVEDQRMPVGEKAHRLGFIVLPEAGARKLFSVTEADADFVVTSRDEGRLTAFLVPARLLLKVSADSRKAALEAVARHAKDEILRLRDASAEKEVTYRDGRHHALLLQQHANARLALDEG